MTIKKLKPIKATTASEEDVAEMPTEHTKTGATIADRFKLDMPDPAATKRAMVSKRQATIALVAALAALALAGLLTFTLFQHWTFLQGA